MPQRQVFPHDAAQRFVEATLPGARIERVRRLRGGLGARTHVLSIETQDGRHGRVVLRRYLPNDALFSERAEREFRILKMVHEAGIPSPRALGLDARGEIFDTPTLLLTYLPGRSLYHPRDEDLWREQLAHAMLSIHAITPRDHDLSWLPGFSRDEIALELNELGPLTQAAGELAQRVHAALIADLDRVAWPEPCLIHEDFWPGNTVWVRQHLVGVIDWINAKLGDPRCDVTQCAIDTMLVMGPDVADRLRDTYQRLAPAPLPDLWYFDLFNGLRSFLFYKHWLLGYHDAGLTHMTEELAGSRIEALLVRSLKHASSL